MNKNFDEWNNIKKFINYKLTNLPYRERDVWWTYLGRNVGFEQDGDGVKSERPSVIIKGFSKELCWIIPLTSVQKNNRYYFPVGQIDKESASAIISQMKPIDTKRLINKIGILDQNTFTELKKAVKKLL